MVSDILSSIKESPGMVLYCNPFWDLRDAHSPSNVSQGPYPRTSYDIS